MLAPISNRLYLKAMADHCAHDHSHDHGLKDAALHARMAAVEARCLATEQRLTAPRRRVLELMLQAGQPVKAYDLMASYGQDGEGPAKPPTVYRALEFLESQGLIHRIESLNAYVVCQLEEGHSAAFLICDCCGATTEVEPGEAGLLAGGLGFAIKHVTIEAHGLCAECQ